MNPTEVYKFMFDSMVDAKEAKRRGYDSAYRLHLHWAREAAYTLKRQHDEGGSPPKNKTWLHTLRYLASVIRRATKVLGPPEYFSD